MQRGEGGRYTVKVDEKIYNRIKEVAEELTCSLSSAAAILIIEGFKKREIDARILSKHYGEE